MANSATPRLVVDLTVLQRNIAAMAAAARRAGLDLRPHVKSHKCLEIARLQLAAGARGITVATVAEAEVFVRGGFDDVFIAYPLWIDHARGRRLQALADQATIRVGADSAESLTEAVRHLGTARQRIEFLVEVDSGHRRTGCAPEDAGDIAAAADRLGLRVAGVFTFPGHSYAPEAPGPAAGDESSALTVAAAALSAAGIAPRVRSGGSSPSVRFADPEHLTELRPGVYVFGDAQQLELGSCTREDVALTVHATVVSRRGRCLVLDAGSKTLGADRPPWASGNGRLLDHPDARIVALSEHHATVELSSGAAMPTLGSIVRVVPNHVCSAVNLGDRFDVVVEGDVVDHWAVQAGHANT